MRSLKSWFVKEAPPDRRGADRVATPWLVAYDWSGSDTKRHNIRDISATGLYLLTEERWAPGELVSIGLHKKDLPAENAGHGLPMQVKAVRWGLDGVGLSFVQAKDMDLHFGENPLADAAEWKEPEDVMRMLRMAKASAFVDQICPSISEDVKGLIRDRLSTFRVGNAIDIALNAEEMLAPAAFVGRKRAHPRLVMRILEDGSWTDDNAIRKLWAGLLVASCTEDGDDESNMEFVTLLSDIASEHVQIFVTACARANVFVSESGSVSAQPLVLTLEELGKITCLHDMNRIDVDIDHLTVFGLFEKRVKSSSYMSVSEAVIRPSSLGLELYARCHGHRGATKDFYGALCKGEPAPDEVTRAPA